MCYSAEAWTLYQGYIDEFGAEIDIEEFWKVYLERDEKYRVRKGGRATPKIPKGMDLSFLNPTTEREREIRDLINAADQQKILDSEQELFKQVKRLADAERQLAVKETKTALNEQRIAGNKIKQMKRWIGDAKRKTIEPTKDNRIFPLWYCPVLIVEDAKPIVRPMRYLCRPQGMPASSDYTKTKQVSGKYNARRDNLDRFWRRQFGHTHGLMLAETFYENVDDGRGGSKEIQFRPKTSETMFIACLYSHWTDPTGEEPDLWSFAAITDDPEPEVAAVGHDRTIINIKPEHTDAWLTPEGRSDEELFGILDDKRHPFYEVIAEAA